MGGSGREAWGRVAHALDDIRYTVPCLTDGERFRWPIHPLWQAVQGVVVYDLCEMTTGVSPGVVIVVQWKQLAHRLEAMIVGLLATWSIATGVSIDSDALARKLGEMGKR